MTLYKKILNVFLCPSLHRPMVVLQQAFRDSQDWVGYMSEYPENVAVDFHEYHAFGPYWNVDVAEADDGWQTNIDTSCAYR